MKRERVAHLVSKLNHRNSEYPGIIDAAINKTELPFPLLSYKFNNITLEISEICSTLAALTNTSIDETKRKVLLKFQNTSEHPVSTTALGKIIGIKARPYIFEYLLQNNLIERRDNKYILTDEGLKYGDYAQTDEGGQYIVWHRNKIKPKIQTLLDNVKRKLQFPIYHMTHIDNLPSILTHGLLSHNASQNHVDISNQLVNSFRNRATNPLKLNLHDYVPFYFNVRNPMLFTCAKEWPNQIVIIEVEATATLKDYSLFSEGNAAKKDAEITEDKYKMLNFDWDSIYEKKWTIDGITNKNLKNMMMSECLIYKRLDPSEIKLVHFQDQETELKFCLSYGNKTQTQTSPTLFF